MRVEWWLDRRDRAKSPEEERERAMEQMQRLSLRALNMQEADRRHLARELHDEVGQMLTGLRLLLKPGESWTAESINARLDHAREIVDELLERVRDLSFDLRPAALDQLGLVPTLMAFFDRYTERTGVLVSFKHQRLDVRPPPDVETAIFRIVQEALTNVARHAGVAGVNVRLWLSGEMLHVQVEDHGRGFDTDRALGDARSSGLAGMQERVVLLKGHLTVESRPGGGTSINAELPAVHQSRRGGG